MANVVPLYALRPSSQVVGELTWFFQRSASEMGMGSSWESLSYLARSGCAHSAASPEDRMTERRVEAARRHRRIYSALMQCPLMAQAVLELHYDERRLPPELVRHLSAPVALVATRSPVCRDAFKAAAGKARAREDSLLAWLTGLCIRAAGHPTTADASLLSDIRIESEAMDGAAHRSFQLTYARPAPVPQQAAFR